MIKNCYIYLFEGFSDWEIAYLTPELNKSEKCQLLYVSKDSQTVCSMGGLKVTTDLILSEIDPAKIDLFILPGGTMWENNMDNEVASFILNLKENNKPMAAICGATVALAKLGMLNHIGHTSNALEYMKWAVPAYSAEEYYKNQPAVTDQNIITASGIYPIEFACEVFRLLEIMNEAEIEKWYQLYKHGVWML